MTNRQVRILAIDGGGIRGIIPARVLVELEELAEGRRIAELFDLIAGTSTGGILALGATVPDASGRARYSAQELLDIYVSHGADIFPGGGSPTWRQRLLGPSGGRHLGRDLWGAAQRMGSVFGGNPRFAGNARYFPTGLEGVLAERLGDTPLGDAVTPVVVTAYDMRAGAPVVFRSSKVRGLPEPRMRDVARATSAGPTYFPPQQIDVEGSSAVLVDGGLAANNPAMIAYTDAVHARPGMRCVLLSLGTGTRAPAAAGDITYDAIRSRNWLKVGAGVLTASMDGSSELQDQMLRSLLNRPHEPASYWRLQTEVGGCNFAMDDASETNVRCLLRLGERLATDNRDRLGHALALLLSDNGPTAVRVKPQPVTDTGEHGEVLSARSHTTPTRGDVLAGDVEGTVKWWSSEKGFGFLTPDDGGEDVFVHFTGIQGEGFPDLMDGQRVLFQREPGDKGPRAVRVRLQQA